MSSRATGWVGLSQPKAATKRISAPAHSGRRGRAVSGCCSEGVRMGDSWSGAGPGNGAEGDTAERSVACLDVIVAMAGERAGAVAHTISTKFNRAYSGA